jgi:hypothetical protein
MSATVARMAVLVAGCLTTSPFAWAQPQEPPFQQFLATPKHRAFVAQLARETYAKRLAACPATTVTPSDDHLVVEKPVTIDSQGLPIAGRWTEFVILAGCGLAQTLPIPTFDALPAGLRFVTRVRVHPAPDVQPGD